MRKLVFSTALLLISYRLAFAQDSNSLTTPCPARGAENSGPSMPPVQEAALVDEGEPEEPDYAFIAGGPYTQKKNSIQLIFPAQWGRRTSTLSSGTLQHAEFGTLLRTEWGFTDRLELDVIFSAEGERDFLGERKTNSTFAMSDSVVGIRYRLLQESSAPLTLATGPQFIFPTGRFSSGTGNAAMGYAWDLATAKDWGGPLFVYSSLNYAFFPSARPPGSTRHFNLQNLFWGSALGVRPLEKDRGPNHHDVHIFLEYGLGREEGLETDGPMHKVAETVSLFAPGIRYGFLTRTWKLFEIGVAFPVGLNHNTPRGGVIVQLQFERSFGNKVE
jgi:hypothetical protein